MHQLQHIQLICKLLRFLYLEGIPEAREGGKEGEVSAYIFQCQLMLTTVTVVTVLEVCKDL